MNLIYEFTNCPVFFSPVAEQAESIDNPMHEAAKRGVTPNYIFEHLPVFFFFFFIIKCLL